MCGEEEKLYKNTPVLQQLHQSRIGLELRNILSVPQKEQMDISGVLETTLFFFSVLQKARKITASHKGSDSNRDRAFQGDLVENT